MRTVGARQIDSSRRSKPTFRPAASFRALGSNLPMDAPLLLTGFMGAGKTTAGRLVAELAGAPFADLADVIAHDAGEPVTSLLATRGEPAFRALEAAALRRLLQEPSPSGPARVIALGGGALLDLALRREALDRACV